MKKTNKNEKTNKEIVLVDEQYCSLFVKQSRIAPIQYKIMNLIIARINNNMNLKTISNEDLIITITKETLRNEEFKTYNEDMAVQLLDTKIRYVDDINSEEPEWEIFNLFSYAKYDNNILEFKLNMSAMNFIIETNFNLIQISEEVVL